MKITKKTVSAILAMILAVVCFTTGVFAAAENAPVPFPRTSSKSAEPRLISTNNGFAFLMPEDADMSPTSIDHVWILEKTSGQKYLFCFAIGEVENNGDIYDSIVAYEADNFSHKDTELYYYVAEDGSIYSDDILEVVYNIKGDRVVGNELYDIYVIHGDSIICISVVQDENDKFIGGADYFDDVIDMIYAGFRAAEEDKPLPFSGHESNKAGKTAGDTAASQKSGYKSFDLIKEGKPRLFSEQESSKAGKTADDTAASRKSGYESSDLIKEYMGNQDFEFVNYGDTINVKGVGKYTFSGFNPAGKLIARNEHFGDTNFIGSIITCDYVNTSNYTNWYAKNEDNLIPATLVFLTEDGDFDYRYHSEGHMESTMKGMSFSLSHAIGAQTFAYKVEPMEGAQIVLWYKTPDLIQQEKGGTVLLIMEFETGTYVTVLRDNGRNLY